MAAWQLHVDLGVEQAEHLPGNDSGTRSGTAGKRLADAALVHAQVDIVTIPDLHKADVGFRRKTFVVLDGWSKIGNRRVGDVANLQNTVRIAHGDRENIELAAADVELVLRCVAVRHKRYMGRFEIRRSHADRHKSIRPESRGYRAGRALERQAARPCLVPRQNARHAANAVAALLDFGAVRVEYPVACGVLRIVGSAHPHHLVKTGTGCFITEFSQCCGRRYRQVQLALIDNQYFVSGALHFEVSNLHFASVTVVKRSNGLLIPASVVLHKALTKLITLPLGRVMRHIMVMNAKGGCGKSTLATNIASYFANEGAVVALADYDPQRSSLDWLERRPENRPEIHGVAGFKGGLRRVPRNAEYVIIDAPARSHGTELTNLVKHAETIIVPVLPSTIDMQATERFLDELKAVGKVSRKQAKIATVANRVRDNTLIFDDLDEYLTKARVPYIAALREAQNYVRAYTRGLGIFELPEYLAWPDWDEWEPLTAWLRSVRSQP